LRRFAEAEGSGEVAARFAPPRRQVGDFDAEPRLDQAQGRRVVERVAAFRGDNIRVKGVDMNADFVLVSLM